MASPQTKYGYTRFAHDLLEATFRFGFTAAQYRLILWVGRNSFGWGRKWTRSSSLKEIEQETKVPKASVGWALGALIEAGVIVKDETSRYAINKDYDTWLKLTADRLPLSNRLDGLPKTPSNGLDEPSNGLDGSSNGLDEKPPLIRNLKKEERKEERKGPRAPFIPPTLDEVKAYCLERKNGVNAQKWHDHYTSNGWRVGKNPMKDWRAAVRTWENSDFAAPRPAASKGGAAPVGGKYGDR